MLLLLLAAAMSSAQTPAQTPAPTASALVRVFVRTDDTGEPSELAARRQSVQDLASALASKKKSLAVVEDEDQADVTVDVVDRGLLVPKVVIGISPRPGEPTGMAGPTRTVVLRVRLAFGQEAVGLTNKNKPTELPDGWKRAADDLGGQIEKWIAAHRAEILKRRGGTQTAR